MKKITLESIISIAVILVVLICRQSMAGNISEFELPDSAISAVISSVFYLALAYISGRWIFHFTVGTADKRGAHILLISDLVILGLYFSTVIFLAIMRYTGLWEVSSFIRICYAHFFMYCSSKINVALNVLLGVIFAFAVTIREK